MSNKYSINLDGARIGTTCLELADSPMGVVMGLIHFEKIESPYLFFRDYCKYNNVVVNEDEPEHELLDTQAIEGLSVFNEGGIEIKGMATSVRGFKEEGFYIDIIGIAYPFYGEEFPHHVEAYEKQFD